jgi:hypothetical protein
VEDFEKLGTFYLGREYDLAKKETSGLLLYDSKDLVTHGVCVGMTGSGKTGLCIALLEEAALDGIPAIVIDPKGDLGDLMLTFPDLRPEDLLPWVDPEEAAKQGLSPEDFAKQQADAWKQGLAEWGEDGARIARLKAAADFTIYTPGSNAGLPVSILKSLAAPSAAVQGDEEALQDRVSTAVTSLLGLIGVTADPIQSREHILLSSLFAQAWAGGLDLSLAGLIQQIQKPPFAKVGVLDLESFYPAKERFGLAMLINNLLAAPGFQTWLEGEPLDIGRMLFTPEGKARVSIFSIAHLTDAERMFFVSMLLNEVLGWVRSQPGTGSLRAIVYMDEIFGFFPPVAEPASKKPLLTLLKQARAFGVGILLATQNPVDLDYKGLANAGTWFIGRLQTERDKDRLLEGLEGVAAGSEAGFDRQKMGETLAGLGKRVFLMYNVHEDAPVTFSTRWTMSYLAGPLTRAQIKTLMDPRRPAVAAAPQTSQAAQTPMTPDAAVPVAAPSMVAAAAAPAAAEAAPEGAASAGLPAEIPQYYLPLRGSIPANATLVYKPGVLAAATVSFVGAATGAGASTKIRRVAQAPESALAVDWDTATAFEPLLEDLDRQPYAGATLAALPAAMTRLSSYRSWASDFSGWTFRTQTMELFKSAEYGMTSNPGETEGEFRARLQLAARESRDATSDKLRQKYAAKLATLQTQEMRAQQTVAREAEQAKARKMQTAISLGATVLGAFLGRKVVSSSTLGRATTTMRDVGRSMDEAGDVKRAEETLGSVKQKHADLEAEFQSELDALEGKTDPGTETLEKVLMRPRKSDINVDSLGLVWTPYWRDASGTETGAWG